MKTNKYRLLWLIPTALALIIAITLALLPGSEDSAAAFGLVARAASPDDITDAAEALPDALYPLFEGTAAELLGGGKNTVYSPISSYISLAMTAQCARGDSRQQILDAAGCKTADELARHTGELWRSLYFSGSAVASSLWVNSGAGLKGDVLRALTDDCYASVYRGDLNSDETLAELKAWLKDNTGDDLHALTDDIEMPATSGLALLNALEFEQKWAEPFYTDDIWQNEFYTQNGSVTADFMHTTAQLGYSDFDGFSSVVKDFADGSSLCVLLPDEGVSVEELLSDSTALYRAAYKGDYEKRRVALSLPKFSITDSHDMAACYKALGITDVYDESKADLTALSDDLAGYWIGSSMQGAAVTVDENGAKASAFGMEVGVAKGEAPDTVYFSADRPFVFVIFSKTSLPMFVGAVYDPTE